MKKIASVLLVLLLAGLTLATACRPAFVPPPSLPPAYYEAAEVQPDDLWLAYFGPTTNRWEAERLYTGKAFVFKDQVVTTYMLEHKDEGFMWLGRGIKTTAADANAVRRLQVGQHIDIVGLNAGIPEETFFELIFNFCYFLPAGTLGLPLPESGGDFHPIGY